MKIIIALVALFSSPVVQPIQSQESVQYIDCTPYNRLSSCLATTPEECINNCPYGCEPPLFDCSIISSAQACVADCIYCPGIDIDYCP